MQIKLYKTNSRLHIRGIDRCPIVKSILSSGWSGTRIEPFHLWPRFFYGKTKFVFFVVAALAVFDNERGKGEGEEKKKKKKEEERTGANDTHKRKKLAYKKVGKVL